MRPTEHNMTHRNLSQVLYFQKLQLLESLTFRACDVHHRGTMANEQDTSDDIDLDDLVGSEPLNSGKGPKPENPQIVFRCNPQLHAAPEKIARRERRKKSDVLRHLMIRGIAAYMHDRQLFLSQLFVFSENGVTLTVPKSLSRRAAIEELMRLTTEAAEKLGVRVAIRVLDDRPGERPPGPTT